MNSAETSPTRRRRPVSPGRSRRCGGPRTASGTPLTHRRSRRDPARACVHAHLRRIEGDVAKTAGGYRRAEKPARGGSLDGEREEIARVLLSEAP